MRRSRPSGRGEGALELIEQAIHLLRLSGAHTLVFYYFGAAPFVLGLLYFWGDMSRSSSAADRCPPAALGVALLFCWMKTWQSVFVGRLRAQITGRADLPLTGSRLFRVALVQTALQPSGLFVLPLALLVTLPFGWVYCFYQSVTASDDASEVKAAFQKAKRQAQLWPKQNHLLLAVFLLLGLVVLINVTVAIFQIPSLFKTLFGVDTAFTRGGWSVFNTTFLAAVCGLTYLCLDPLVKTVYLLRCFYGESLHTGEDLTAELKPLTAGARGAAAVLALAVLLIGAFPFLGAHGDDEGRIGAPASGPARFVIGAPDPKSALRFMASLQPMLSAVPASQLATAQPPVSPLELDRSISQVINQREFNWRLPREKRADDTAEKGWVASLVDGIVDTIRAWGRNLLKWLKTAVDWIADFMDWLKEKVFGKGKTASPARNSRSGWIIGLQVLIFVLLALASSVAAVLFYRTWRRNRRRALTLSEAVAPVPDLADESIVASQLPADEWLKLARDLLGKGELRLGLRALYLASLAHLAQREMISVAKFKSNHDYERELQRRARALPELLSAFAENVGIFDRVWYGLHEVTDDVVQRFQINLEKIMA